MLIGEEANLTRRTCSFSADESGNFLGVITSKNDRIILIRRLVNSPDIFAEFDIGTGSVADICGDGTGGFFVFYSDTSQNNWIEHIAQNNTRKRIKLDSYSISGAAIARVVGVTSQSLVTASIKNNGVFIRRLEIDLGNMGQETCLENENADSVSFVKNSALPDLLINRGGRIFLRRLLSPPSAIFANIKLNAQVRFRADIS